MTNTIPNYERAQKTAEDLLKEYDIDEPIVPVLELAERKGLKIKIIEFPEKMENVAGVLDPGSKKTIYVNKADPVNRQVFTIAHELGHFLLGHSDNQYNPLLRYPRPKETIPAEKEANCFAANLLVPKHLLIQKMREFNLSNRDTLILSKLFGVSEEVMKYRVQHI